MKQSLFRTIRRKLLTEGKLVRYLTYALGEILLIVVGILFALKINDWNEDRKRAALEGSYLVALYEDTERSLERNDIQISFMTRTADLLGVVMRCLKAGEIPEADRNEFTNGLWLAGKLASVPLLRDTIDELVSTGYMATIRSEAIKDQLNIVIDHYDYLNGIRTFIFDRVVLPMQYIDSQVIYKFEEPTAGAQDIRWEQLEINLEDLSRDQRFYTAVASIRSLTYDVTEQNLGFVDELETLRKLLKEELDSRNLESQ